MSNKNLLHAVSRSAIFAMLPVMVSRISVTYKQYSELKKQLLDGSWEKSESIKWHSQLNIVPLEMMYTRYSCLGVVFFSTYGYECSFWILLKVIC